MYLINVLDLNNLHDGLFKDGDRIKIGWKRNSEVRFTHEGQIVKNMAVVLDKFKITASMLFCKREQRFQSKLTQFILYSLSKDKIIAECEFDLADFIGVDMHQHYLEMSYTEAISTRNTNESSELDTSLNSLLKMTDDDYFDMP